MPAGSQHVDDRHRFAPDCSHRHGTLMPAYAADLDINPADTDAFISPLLDGSESLYQWPRLPPRRRQRSRPKDSQLPPRFRGNKDEDDEPHHCRQTRRRTSNMVAPWPLGRALGAAAAAALLLFPPVADAVQVPFRNCLSETYRLRSPTPLQWTPLYADAVFDTVGKSHNLQLTVWGNVSGSINTAELLPDAGDPSWLNPNETLGKIVRTPEPDNARPVATTLHSSVNVLTYRPYHLATDFCATSLINGSCPLGPIFEPPNDSTFPYYLPSVVMSHDFWSSYAFTSFSTQFSIIYGDSAATQISCVASTITPDLGNSLTWMLTVFPVAILTVVGLATVYASICSACGTADIFYWSSNFSRQPDLLRLVTPGFGDCLQYIQFVILTGALSLDYPGFYQPITSKVGWSALMFNSSLVSHEPAWVTLVDGIYITNGTYGLERMGQLVGMPTMYDIWAGMIVWLLVLIASITVIFQVAFLSKWLYRHLRNTPEEDLRSKNGPFSIGTMFRIVFGFFMLPLVTLSTFQLVVAESSPPYVTIAAVITILLVIIFVVRVFVLILRTKPRVNLFDDLRTLLLYGPLYNTYSDEAAPYALVPLVLTLVRGIAIGAVQPSGIAQLVLLAICEIIQIMTIHAFRPFHRSTSMNAYHTGFCLFRFVSVMLMVAFVPSLEVDDGSKGWIGYVILFLHAIILVLGFFLNALQKMVEVTAYVMGVGAEGSQSRGGFMRIFGARQLSRRMTRKRHHHAHHNHHTGPSRASHLSSTAMLDADEHSRSGYMVPGSHLRSSSAASLGGLLQSRHMSASIGDSELYSPMPGTNSFPPNTPATNSGFSFPMSGRPSISGPGGVGIPMEAADPYYRPPRLRREFTTDTSSGHGFSESPTASPRRQSQIAGGASDMPDVEGGGGGGGGGLTRGGTRPGYGHGSIQFMPRTDYSTREVDFYYRVRGPALNSDGPGRKLGTGPADPTGPMSTASSWLRSLIFGGKSKEKSKGFEVVRSSRMPPSMMRAAAADYADDRPPEGIPVAMGVLRSGPIESDDDDEANGRSGNQAGGQLVDVSAEPRDSAEGVGLMGGKADSPRRQRAGGESSSGGEQQSQPLQFSDIADALPLPEIPRKSSRRNSGPDKKPAPFLLASPPPLPRTSGSARSREELPRLLTRQGSTRQPSNRSNPSGRSIASSSVASRLPFERSGSQRDGPSSTTSSIKDYPHLGGTERDHYDGANFGHVRRHNASLVDLDFDAAGGGHGLMSRSAEIVNEDSIGSRESSLRR